MNNEQIIAIGFLVMAIILAVGLIIFIGLNIYSYIKKRELIDLGFPAHQVTPLTDFKFLDKE